MIDCKTRNLYEKIILTSLLLLLAFLPGKILAAESIAVFDSEIKINKDGSVNVIERIEYDFGDTQKENKFYRIIPLDYEVQGKKYSLDVFNFYVTDENGVLYSFSGRYFEEQGMLFRIWDSNEFALGKKTYVIKYKVREALNYSENHDEFHWNAVANSWVVPVENVTTRIILPDGTQDIKVNCSVGSYKHLRYCNFSQDGNIINFSNEKLPTSEEFALSVEFQKGVVTEPTEFDRKIDTLKRYYWVFAVFILGPLLGLFYLILKIRGFREKGLAGVLSDFLSDKFPLMKQALEIKKSQKNRNESSDFIKAETQDEIHKQLMIKKIQSMERKTKIGFFVSIVIFIGGFVFIYLAITKGIFTDELMLFMWRFLEH